MLCYCTIITSHKGLAHSTHLLLYHSLSLICGQADDDVSHQVFTSNYTSDGNNLKLMSYARALSGHLKSLRQEAGRRGAL